MPMRGATVGPAAALPCQTAEAAPTRTGFYRLLADTWRRSRERQIAHAVYQLGHPGVLDDFRCASRQPLDSGAAFR